MKLRIIISVFFLTPAVHGISQQNPDKILKEFFTAVQKKDSLKFTDYYLTSGELSEILKAMVLDTLNVDSLRYKSKVNDEKYVHALMHGEFQKIKLQADSLKINLNNCRYSDCKYQIIKDPQILFTSLTGTIYFKEKNHDYELTIKEAIYINDTWKIVETGTLSPISDSSLFSKEHTKISAFNSLEFEIKVTDLKLEAVEKEKRRPPPPPPPPKRSKKKN